MSKIKQLDAKLSNMIAAGEVVERPSGIIKELVENSIDAQSKRIVIEIQQGGITYLQVSDDGIGMDQEDALLAFKRHATSKIKHEKDLFAIQTLGFRGEALPSIASVSDVKLTTNNDKIGSLVHVKYGELLTNQTISRNIGTTITVSKLFQNTPARLKHLKSTYYEASRVADVVKKIACSYPEISFLLISDDKKILETSGNGQKAEVLLQLYDYTVVKDLIDKTIENNDFKIHLLLAQPQFTRKNNSILIYINNRMIRSYPIQKAVIEGYKNYIPADRQPIAVINIEVDYQLVDVNVHPSKWEVRISKEYELTTLISESIQKLLHKDYTIPKASPIQYKQEPIEFVYKVKEDITTYEKPSLTEVQPPIVVIPEPQSIIVEESPVKYPLFSQLKVLAQLQGKYILCESEEGLYIIDQHAAAERINYEKIQKLVLSNNDQQQTLIPFLVKLAPNAIPLMNEIITKCAEIHLYLEQFSDNSLIVRSVPNWIVKENEQAIVEDIISQVIEESNLSLEALRKHAIATSACHHSIRFNRHLALIEMETILSDLAKCDHPYHCPHGRTILILLDNYRLEKEFMRVGS